MSFKDHAKYETEGKPRLFKAAMPETELRAAFDLINEAVDYGATITDVDTIVGATRLVEIRIHVFGH